VSLVNQPADIHRRRGPALHGANISVAKGQEVPITVTDPQSSFAKEGTTPGAHLTLGVVAVSGAFHPALISASSAVSRTYSVIIPFDSPTKIYIMPGAFQLTDSAGNAVASAGTSVQVTASSSSSTSSSSAAPSLSFVLKGLGTP
jgi:hypothetical protein